jgi:hypothetical protein
VKPLGKWRFSFENLFVPARRLAVAASLNLTAALAVIRVYRGRSATGAAALSLVAAIRLFRRIRFTPGAAELVLNVSVALTRQTPSYVHFIVSGQSNSKGSTGYPLIPHVGPPVGRMFNGGVYPRAVGANLLSFVPLVEGTPISEFPPGSDLGETPATGCAQSLKAAFPIHTCIFSNVGGAGAFLNQMNKGTTAYADSIAQVTAAKTICDALDVSFRVGGILFVHGETDEQFATATYGAMLTTLQTDYDTDIKAITGQSELVRIFITQQGGYHLDQYNNTPTNANSSNIQMYNAWRANPNKIVMVGNRNWYDSTDGLHHTASGFHWMGEVYGAVISKVAFEGVAWETIYPLSAVLTGSQIVVDFHAPSPPLKANYSLMPYQKNMGFFYQDDAGPSVTVTNATITGPTQVTLQLSGAPAGGARRLKYGCKRSYNWISLPKINGGGNLCDSTDWVLTSGRAGINFAPQFNIPIT